VEKKEDEEEDEEENEEEEEEEEEEDEEEEEKEEEDKGVSKKPAGMKATIKAKPAAQLHKKPRGLNDSWSFCVADGHRPMFTKEGSDWEVPLIVSYSALYDLWGFPRLY